MRGYCPDAHPFHLSKCGVKRLAAPPLFKARKSKEYFAVFGIFHFCSQNKGIKRLFAPPLFKPEKAKSTLPLLSFLSPVRQKTRIALIVSARIALTITEQGILSGSHIAHDYILILQPVHINGTHLPRFTAADGQFGSVGHHYKLGKYFGYVREVDQKTLLNA